METSKPLIDFKELVSNVPGEGLEELTRLLARGMGLSPSWSGRGPDGGRDLLFTEILSGPIAKEKITWLVSCKDKATSGDSVNERDLPSPGIGDKLVQHKANGFLLVTTTTVSAAAKSLLDSLDNSNDGKIHTHVWDSSELTRMLLDPINQGLLKQFFPQSYRTVQGLTSLEGSVLTFRDQLPEEILTEVMRLVSPYSSSSLKGSAVWPYDLKSAEAIDNIVIHLVIEQDTDAAVAATEQIEYGAFVELVNNLVEKYNEECYKYLYLIIRDHHESDIRFNAAQLLADNYQLEISEIVEMAYYLDSDMLKEFCSEEITSVVIDEIYTNTPDYDLYQSLDELSSGTQIEEVHIESLLLDTGIEDGQVHFSGKMSIYATFVYGGEEMGGDSFPGMFSGYMDKQGVCLDNASVDTSLLFRDDDDELNKHLTT